MAHMAHTSYLNSVFDKRSNAAAIKFICRALELVDCDAIAFTGMSGALMAPKIAELTGKKLVMVRKSGDDSHSSFRVEATTTKVYKYVIIDDLIFSGRTVNHIIKTLKESSNFQLAKCQAIIMYAEKGETSYKTVHNGLKIYNRKQGLPRKKTPKPV